MIQPVRLHGSVVAGVSMLSMNIHRLLLLACIVIYAGDVAGQGNAMFDLGDYRWKYRLLFVAADSDSNPLFQRFRQEKARSMAEIADRDLFVVELCAAGQSRVGEIELEGHVARHLRAILAIGDDPFTIVLIGKDGTEKFRRTHDVKLSEIFAVIDTMPMRQREMREKGTQSFR